RVLDFALDHRTDRMNRREGIPRIRLRLLQAERDATLVGIDLEDEDFDFLAGRNDLARMNILLRPGHFGNMDQPFDAGLKLDEGTIFGDVGDTAREACADRIFRFRALPGITLELLHAQADALRVLVDADDLPLHD